MNKNIVVFILSVFLCKIVSAQHRYEKLSPYYHDGVNEIALVQSPMQKRAASLPLIDRFLSPLNNQNWLPSSGVSWVRKALFFNAFDADTQLYLSNPGNIDTCDILQSAAFTLSNSQNTYFSFIYSTGNTWQTDEKLLLQFRHAKGYFFTVWESGEASTSMAEVLVNVPYDSMNLFDVSFRFVNISRQSANNTQNFVLHGVWYSHRADFPFRESFLTGSVSSIPTPLRWQIANTQNDSDGPGNSWLTRFNAQDEGGFQYAGFGGSADTLQSHPINLAALAISDSVMLSFLYKSTEATRNTDTLILEVRNNMDQWQRLWSGRATSNNVFTRVSHQVNTATLRHKQFQFRFRSVLTFSPDDSAQFELASISLSRILALPFVEDFSTSTNIPNPQKWQSRSTFINPDFAKNPPSINVATFDGMDGNGMPYGIGKGYCDTLLSLPINLSGLAVADSVYLSFMIQSRGWGETPNNDDLLFLYIRNDVNDATSFTRVWQTGPIGIGRDTFSRFDILIEDSTLFHTEVQLLFVNIGNRSGNINHWHIDYIRLDRGRRANDDYPDIAITNRPRSLLTPYYSMPVNHFTTNPTSFTKNSQRIFTRNHFSEGRPIEYSRTVKLENITVDSFVNILPNFLALRDTSITINSPVVLNPSGMQDTISFNTIYESGIIGRNVNPDNIPSNDFVIVPTHFSNFFAYDDGTAESGYGIDLEPGAVALGFDLAVPDTLFGISMHFNRSFIDVSDRSFDLMVWSAVATNANGTGQVVLKRLPLQAPQYYFSRNAFHYFKLDEPLALPAGKFFIGWEQTTVYNLNVGWDENYERDGTPNTNPNLFIKIRDLWRGTQLLGTPMIRAITGKWIDPPTGAREVIAVSHKNDLLHVQIYPNPAQSYIRLTANVGGDLLVNIFDTQGKLCFTSTVQTEKLDLSLLKNGMYFVHTTDTLGRNTISKLIIQH